MTHQTSLFYYPHFIIFVSIGIGSLQRLTAIYCMPTKCISPTPLLSLLKTDAEYELLASTVVHLEFDRNDHIIIEGEPVKHLHYLCSGRVMLYRDGLGQRDYIVRLAQEGHFFGMRPFFASGRSLTSAIASDRASVCRIPESTINSLMGNNADVARYFLKTLAHELDAQEARMISMAHKHLRGRLAETLLMLLDQYGYRPDGTTLNINLKRSELASLSNMTISNASRTLSILASERVIALDKRSIKIINPSLLEQVSRNG